MIDCLIDAEKTKGLGSLVGNFFNVKSLKNMGIVTDLTSPPVEIPKEVICNKRISLEDFPIFSSPEPLDCRVSYYNTNYVSDIPTTSEPTEKKKRKLSKKNYERMEKGLRLLRRLRRLLPKNPKLLLLLSLLELSCVSQFLLKLLIFFVNSSSIPTTTSLPVSVYELVHFPWSYF